VGAPPTWREILGLAAVRFRAETRDSSVGLAAWSIGIGTVALLMLRVPFLFWLPWFAVALVVGAGLFRTGKRVAGVAIGLAVFLVPFWLLPREHSNGGPRIANAMQRWKWCHRLRWSVHGLKVNPVCQSQSFHLGAGHARSGSAVTAATDCHPASGFTSTGFTSHHGTARSRARACAIRTCVRGSSFGECDSGFTGHPSFTRRPNLPCRQRFSKADPRAPSDIYELSG
jgi:hypothetical protein